MESTANWKDDRRRVYGCDRQAADTKLRFFHTVLHQDQLDVLFEVRDAQEFGDKDGRVDRATWEAFCRI